MSLKEARIIWIAIPTLALASAGCLPDSAALAEPASPQPRIVNVNLDEIYQGVDAGRKITDKMLPATATIQIAAQMPFLTRMDPFSLLRQEVAYEKSQRAERLLAESGSWLTVWEPPPPPPATPPSAQLEPQPYRRLSGILIGDSVLAIMELENGTSIIVRPGTKIPGTEWTVVSLDADKAVLRRPGPRRPTQIIVKLENPRPGGGGGAEGGGGGGMPGGGGPAGAGGGGRGRGGNLGGGL